MQGTASTISLHLRNIVVHRAPCTVQSPEVMYILHVEMVWSACDEFWLVAEVERLALFSRLGHSSVLLARAN